MAWRDALVNELDFRADLWLGLCQHGGRVLHDALTALADADLADVPCRPVLWQHARSLHLSDVQLDLVWLHWFVCVRKCPTVPNLEAGAQARADKLRALLRRAVFPHVDEGEDLSLACCCPRGRRGQWAALFDGAHLVGRSHVLPFSPLMRGALEGLEKPEDPKAKKPKDEARLAPYDATLARAAENARLKRKGDPVGHWVEEAVGQFGIAEEFFVASADDRVALLRRVLQPDAR